MSSWGNYDNAANAPYWAVNSTIVNATDVKNNAAMPTAANVALLFGNTTSNVYTVGETIGLFAVDSQEQRAYQGTTTAHAPHMGWVLRTTGQGGRAGRVQHETLVCLANVYSDSDGQQFPNVTISLATSGDTSVLANATYFANVATFTVTPTLTGNTNATLTYQWQYNNSTGTFGWANIPANTTGIHFAGATTSTLYVMPGTTANTTNRYRAIVTAAAQGVTATSSNNIITIT
jgi:hypothetical protein